MPTVRPSPLRLSAIALFLIAGAGLFGSEVLPATGPGVTPTSRPVELISTALISSSLSPYFEIGQAATGRPSASPLPTPSLPSATPTNKPAKLVLFNFSIPALGINGPIRNLSQCGETLPDMGIWSWGDCAGENNLVLLAHAYGSFAPIYYGYHSGALRVGLAASYADVSGASHAYFIAQIWRQPVAQAFTGWAWAAEQSPVITLVTCDDPNDTYRIIVRLIPVDTSNPNPTFPPPAAPTATVAPATAPTAAPTASGVPTP
jgi:sortase (surface protein transpeptidase)